MEVSLGIDIEAVDEKKKKDACREIEFETEKLEDISADSWRDWFRASFFNGIRSLFEERDDAKSRRME